ncbi:putative conserved hypothetical protein [Serratia symbiotica str. Tucson]|uniref:Uncharacterized protein n=1 Tax=Serratia symbiotica str. Tucson TaxID=914128 RepID=E9CKT4_9GAMM|nr:hypothetical protein [Serratia symbiotica]EFW12755.1 putative conserved hypothetical protein [Serratia symbiotica str. Tucson]
MGDQESPETLKVDDQAYDNSGGTDSSNDDPEQELEDEAQDDGLVSVVVTKGNTVRHDGQTYLENREFKLPLEEAQRLIGLGVVADVDQLRKQALKRTAPTISIQSGE